MGRLTARLGTMTRVCLCGGGGLLALDILSATPVLALPGSNSVAKGLTLLAGLLLSVALTTASITLLLSERTEASTPDSSAD